MIPLVVVEVPERWPFRLDGVEVVQARDYLTDPRYQEMRGGAVYNLCRRYGYQTLGYYVSLLAEARGHRPLPSVATLQSLHISPVVRSVSPELDVLVQRSLRPLRGHDFELSIYFGRNVARRHDTLARALFNEFPAPLLRARFRREPDPEAPQGMGPWRLQQLRPVGGSDVPDDHVPFVLEQAARFFRRRSSVAPREARWSLAILWSEDDPEPQGPAAGSGDIVHFWYEGFVFDGTPFDARTPADGELAALGRGERGDWLGHVARAVAARAPRAFVAACVSAFAPPPARPRAALSARGRASTTRSQARPPRRSEWRRGRRHARRRCRA